VTRPIVNMSEEDRATDTDNTHKNLVKIALVVPEISCPIDRQTDRHTDTQTHRPAHSLQYFATAPEGEVTSREA